MSITGSSTSSYAYAGREFDGLGIDYYRARYYNPATGRFISEDPTGFAGSGTNLYAYAAGDPIDLIDPIRTDMGIKLEFFAGIGRSAEARRLVITGRTIPKQELMNSPGVNQPWDAFNNGGCRSVQSTSAMGPSRRTGTQL